MVWTWVQQHRWLSLLALLIVIVGTAGGTAWALVFRTVSSPINLKDALRLYRKDAIATTTWRARLPRPGVYTYRTTGGESLSIMGASRTFPATSALIVSGGACASETWAPFVEHTETTVVCPQAHASYAIAALDTHETIGGTTTDATLACPSTLYLIPPTTRAHPGQHWTVHCTLSNPHEPVTVTGLVLGQARLTIGGHTVHTEHIRLTQTYSSPAAGTDPTDFWVEPDSGLIVEAHEAVAITQDGVHYHQASDARLVSLSPVR